MAIRALTLSSVKTIESVQDEAKGTPEATKFTIGAIDAFVSAHVFDRTLTFQDDKTGGSATAQIRMNEANIEAVRFGLKGWSNFKDEKDNDLKFETVEKIVLGKRYTVVSDDCIAVMNPDLLAELAAAIRDVNAVTEDEGKKPVAA